MRLARTFDSLRKPVVVPKIDNINEVIHAIFTTPDGRVFMQWLWDQHVTSQQSMMIDERAYREAEGKKRLVHDLTNRVEEFARGPTGPKSERS